MVYKQHHEIIDAVKKRQPDFNSQVEKYGANLEAVWENLDNPDVMLILIEESNYSSQYYTELTEFARWLREQRQKRDRDVETFDIWFPHKRSAIEAEVDRDLSGGRVRRDESETHLTQRLWNSVFSDVNNSIDALISSAKAGAVWDALISSVEEQKAQGYEPDSVGETQRDIAGRLRELIPNPFLPKIP